VIYEGYEDFRDPPHDVLINCVGTGTHRKLQGDFTPYFTVTEKYDNMAIGYLSARNPNALYISFSSGAVYGRDHRAPMEEDSLNCVRVNRLAPEDYYGIVRLYAEAKHRAFAHLNIIDLRLFAYFSRFIDLADGYFMTEIMDCILNRKVFETDTTNMVRDYLHPDDLFRMILRCMGRMHAGKINGAFDVCSAKPAEKTAILDYFTSEYGLKCKFSPSLKNSSATGFKSIYCSDNTLASEIGYAPESSSMDTLAGEAEYILNGRQ
jgi:nucleoside-diphosphate-sugar epimerase